MGGKKGGKSSEETKGGPTGANTTGGQGGDGKSI